MDKDHIITNTGVNEIEFDKEIEYEAFSKDLKEVISSNKVILFMKGTPEMPMCGYSRLIVEILKHYEVNEFVFVNILKNNNVREFVKKYSDW